MFRLVHSGYLVSLGSWIFHLVLRWSRFGLVTLLKLFDGDMAVDHVEQRLPRCFLATKSLQSIAY